MARAPLICLCVCESTRGEWHKEGSSKSLMYFTHAAYPPQYLRKGQTGLSMPSHWKELLALTWCVIVLRIKRQPVALNHIQTKACRNILIHLIVLFLFYLPLSGIKWFKISAVRTHALCFRNITLIFSNWNVQTIAFKFLFLLLKLYSRLVIHISYIPSTCRPNTNGDGAQASLSECVCYVYISLASSEPASHSFFFFPCLSS